LGLRVEVSAAEPDKLDEIILGCNDGKANDGELLGYPKLTTQPPKTKDPKRSKDSSGKEGKKGLTTSHARGVKRPAEEVADQNRDISLHIIHNHGVRGGPIDLPRRARGRRGPRRRGRPPRVPRVRLVGDGDRSPPGRLRLAPGPVARQVARQAEEGVQIRRGAERRVQFSHDQAIRRGGQGTVRPEVRGRRLAERRTGRRRGDAPGRRGRPGHGQALAGDRGDREGRVRRILQSAARLPAKIEKHAVLRAGEGAPRRVLRAAGGGVPETRRQRLALLRGRRELRTGNRARVLPGEGGHDQGCVLDDLAGAGDHFVEARAPGRHDGRGDFDDRLRPLSSRRQTRAEADGEGADPVHGSPVLRSPPARVHPTGVRRAQTRHRDRRVRARGRDRHVPAEEVRAVVSDPGRVRGVGPGLVESARRFDDPPGDAGPAGIAESWMAGASAARGMVKSNEKDGGRTTYVCKVEDLMRENDNGERRLDVTELTKLVHHITGDDATDVTMASVPIRGAAQDRLEEREKRICEEISSTIDKID
ncbi:hypothetical protein THAOC_06766, partial [Thalassiosira oceanica]